MFGAKNEISIKIINCNSLTKVVIEKFMYVTSFENSFTINF